MKISYSLSKSNKIYFTIVAIINIALFFVFSGKIASEIGELVGRIFAFLTLPAIVAWVVWFLRAKKENAGSLTFNIVLTLALLGQASQFSESLNKDIKKDAVLQEMRDQKDVFLNAVTDTDFISDSTYNNYTGSVKEGFNKLSQSTGSKSEKQFYGLMTSFVEETETLVKSWRDSFSAAQTERILDYSRLKEDEEITYQKKILNHYIEESERYGDYFSNMVQIMEEKLSPLGEGNALVRGALAGAEVKYQAQKPVFEPLMAAHVEYGKVMIGLIDFLKENKPGWSYENEELIFSNDDLLAKFNKFIKLMVEKESTINTLTSKVVKNL